jgi:hypothetical protein
MSTLAAHLGAATIREQLLPVLGDMVQVRRRGGRRRRWAAGLGSRPMGGAAAGPARWCRGTGGAGWEGAGCRPHHTPHRTQLCHHFQSPTPSQEGLDDYRAETERLLAVLAAGMQQQHMEDAVARPVDCCGDCAMRLEAARQLRQLFARAQQLEDARLM